MPFVVRINRPDRGPGNRGWSRPTTTSRHRKLEDAQEKLVEEIETSAGPSPLRSLVMLILRVRARHARPGEHIAVDDYDHWIEEEPDLH